MDQSRAIRPGYNHAVAFAILTHAHPDTAQALPH